MFLRSAPREGSKFSFSLRTSSRGPRRRNHRNSPRRAATCAWQGKRAVSEAMAQTATHSWTMPPCGAMRDKARVSGGASRQRNNNQTQIANHRGVCRSTRVRRVHATGNNPEYTNSDLRDKTVVVVGLGYVRASNTSSQLNIQNAQSRQSPFYFKRWRLIHKHDSHRMSLRLFVLLQIL
jgi:hypothetical protein